MSNVCVCVFFFFNVPHGQEVPCFVLFPSHVVCASCLVGSLAFRLIYVRCSSRYIVFGTFFSLARVIYVQILQDRWVIFRGVSGKCSILHIRT